MYVLLIWDALPMSPQRTSAQAQGETPWRVVESPPAAATRETRTDSSSGTLTSESAGISCIGTREALYAENTEVELTTPRPFPSRLVPAALSHKPRQHHHGPSSTLPHPFPNPTRCLVVREHQRVSERTQGADPHTRQPGEVEQKVLTSQSPRAPQPPSPDPTSSQLRLNLPEACRELR